MKNFLTIDIGASSGRIIVFSLKDNQIKMTVVKRFKHRMKKESNLLFLDINNLMENIFSGLKEAFKLYPEIEALGIDTWGVDYGLLDDDKNLIRDVVNYRSNRDYHLIDTFNKEVPVEKLYNQTGTYPLSFNTIYQLLDDISHNLLDKAKHIVLLPDLIAFYLTGKLRTEITNLSTTSLYDQKNKSIIESLLGHKINGKFPEIIYPTEKYGVIKEELCDKYTLKPIEVIAVCSHDTASAVLPVTDKENTIYISSGTWSLLGTHLEKPITVAKAHKEGFTNEIGYQNKIRFLKNIMGMWVVNKVLETWEEGHEGLLKILKKAEKIKFKDIYINLEDQRFINPLNMVLELKAYFKEKKYEFPKTIEELILIILTNMALSYKKTTEDLENITEKSFTKINILGGGSQNKLLNQLVSNLTQKQVTTGHPESTALGNLAILLIFKKLIKTEENIYDFLDEFTFKETYLPKEVEKWQQTYQKYLKHLKENSNGH